MLFPSLFSAVAAKARAAIDRGDVDTAIRGLVILAREDRHGNIGYEARMRYHEIVGRVEDAGGRERLCAAFREAFPDHPDAKEV